MRRMRRQGYPTSHLSLGAVDEHAAPRDLPEADAPHARIIKCAAAEGAHKLCGVHLPPRSARMPAVRWATSIGRAWRGSPAAAWHHLAARPVSAPGPAAAACMHLRQHVEKRTHMHQRAGWHAEHAASRTCRTCCLLITPSSSSTSKILLKTPWVQCTQHHFALCRSLAFVVEPCQAHGSAP